MLFRSSALEPPSPPTPFTTRPYHKYSSFPTIDTSHHTPDVPNQHASPRSSSPPSSPSTPPAIPVDPATQYQSSPRRSRCYYYQSGLLLGLGGDGSSVGVGGYEGYYCMAVVDLTGRRGEGRRLVGWGDSWDCQQGKRRTWVEGALVGMTG